MTTAEVLAIRRSPEKWFHRFGRVKDLVTQASIISRVKPLQRRGFAHYAKCQAENVPCRQIWLKGRRAGGSDGCSALVYLHAMNYTARIGQLGTNYRTAHNMLDKVKHFGQHDDFPGWGVKSGPKVERAKVTAEDYYGEELSTVPWSERTEKVIDSKIVWPHGSSVELYTAQNPESARSAGLQCFHWTEFFRAPKGGATDGGETLNAMIKTVPKRGFTFIGLEGTAEGAIGAGYELAKSARWPEDAEWWKPWEIVWPQNIAEIGPELQFVLIFAAWYEDWENTLECTPAEEAKIRETLSDKEKQLIERYQQDGPKGPRLGGEVDTTVWNQLKWRRATIEHECKQGGEEEFAQEYPSDPEEAFRASGSPALDRDGLMVLESMARDKSRPPDCGQLTRQNSGAVTFGATERDQATIIRWEEPIIPATPDDRGGRYLVACDPMSGADQVTGNNGEKDRHAIFALRDAYTDHRGTYHPLKVVARIKPPCQWESEVLARQIYLLSLYYGGASIVVEASSSGVAILKSLSADYSANVWQREELDMVSQRTLKKLGWQQSEPARRIIVATLQKYVREQMFELRCMHAVGELLTLIINNKGKAIASGSNKDDDCIALAIGLETIHAAHAYPAPQPIRRVDPNIGIWK
jgi:hypothetical protein